jgi:hypothetical protein
MEALVLTPGSIGRLPLLRREERSSSPITLRKVDLSRGLEDAANRGDGGKAILKAGALGSRKKPSRAVYAPGSNVVVIIFART